MPDDMEEFTREAREFLDAHAPRAAERAAFRWGEGDDRVAYFGADPPEVEERKLRGRRGTGSGPGTPAGSAGSAGRRSTAAAG